MQIVMQNQINVNSNRQRIKILHVRRVERHGENTTVWTFLLNGARHWGQFVRQNRPFRKHFMFDRCLRKLPVDVQQSIHRQLMLSWHEASYPEQPIVWTDNGGVPA